MTQANAQVRGVELPSGQTGSSHLHSVLLATARAFPATFSSVALPEDPARFKKQYAAVLPEFEGARVASPERAQIARFAWLHAEQSFEVADDAGRRPLAAVLVDRAEPLALEAVGPRVAPGLVPAVRDGERRRVGNEILELIKEYRTKHWCTPNVDEAFIRLLRRAEGQGGKLDLRGQRFVLLGAAAELAPVEQLLAGGADVLWLDVREPSAERLVGGRFAGTLTFAKGGADLLRDPGRIAATVRQYAEAGPVHMGLYAYAPGESQEWKLTGTMNALVRALPRGVVSSVLMLVSPTTVPQVCSADASASRLRAERASGWMRALVATGSLRPALAGRTSTPVGRAIVPTQGVSYQAAQYLGKLIAAEAFAAFGAAMPEQPAKPITVSANMAPITATRSLSHPVFEAAFLGAPVFDVLIAKPEATRALNGLLMLHDVLERVGQAVPERSAPPPSERAALPSERASLRPGASMPPERASARPGASMRPGASVRPGGSMRPEASAPPRASMAPPPVSSAAAIEQRIAAALSRQIHGGVCSLPYALEGCIQAAALVGFSKRPGLALGLFR